VTTPSLFPELPAPEEPTEKLSTGRQLTLRQRALVEQGIHPLRGGAVRPDLGTCGDCVHRRVVSWKAGAYPKCWHPTSPRTHGQRTDVRAWWPACSEHELGDPHPPTDDSARWTPDRDS
jgi:hypothetical protein